jgi:hypothetical protein
MLEIRRREFIAALGFAAAGPLARNAASIVAIRRMLDFPVCEIVWNEPLDCVESTWMNITDGWTPG